jgi:hypothetical protein
MLMQTMLGAQDAAYHAAQLLQTGVVLLLLLLLLLPHNRDAETADAVCDEL